MRLLLSSTLLLVGCSQAVGGDTNDDGGGGAGGVAPAEPTYPAVAMTRAYRDVLWLEYLGLDEPLAPADPSIDPNDLFLLISDLGATCSLPTIELPCGGHWSLSIAIPPEKQVVGVYTVAELSKFSSSSVADEQRSEEPTDCGKGFGSLGDSGTIELVEITDERVVVRIAMDGLLIGQRANGDHVAHRCQ